MLLLMQAANGYTEETLHRYRLLAKKQQLEVAEEAAKVTVAKL
jgi:hypothetical protein